VNKPLAQKHHRVLIAYLRNKADIGDWHGVSDAANDLRELEAANPWLVRTRNAG